RRSGARGILPLGLAGQRIGSVGRGLSVGLRLLVQPRDVGAGVVPAHADDGIALGLRMTRLLPRRRGILLPLEDGASAATPVSGGVACLANERGVLAARDVVPAQSERRHR